MVERLPVAQRQIIAIARAVSRLRASSSSMSRHPRLRSRNAASLCDDRTAKLSGPRRHLHLTPAGGRYRALRPSSPSSRRPLYRTKSVAQPACTGLIDMMIGRDISDIFQAVAHIGDAVLEVPPTLQTRKSCATSRFRSAGRIVGISGLVGQKDQLAGPSSAISHRYGEIVVNGRAMPRRHSPRRHSARHRAVPEDRKEEAVTGFRRQNILYGHAQALSRMTLLSTPGEAARSILCGKACHQDAVDRTESDHFSVAQPERVVISMVGDSPEDTHRR